MTEVEALLTRMYDDFNRQDLDALMPAMHPEVEWTNFIEGGKIYGREALRAYWTHQFTEILPEAVPIRMETLDDGRVRVTLAYAARSLEGGGLWLDDVMTNTYSFRDGLVAGMEWGVPVAGALAPETLVEHLVEAFNAKDAAGVVAVMHPHVDWPELLGPERLKGRQAVQAMWTYRFEKWDPQVTLLEISTCADGRVHARARYVVHYPDGRLWWDETFVHHFEFRDGFISRMVSEKT